jgi:hypothetical protein
MGVLPIAVRNVAGAGEGLAAPCNESRTMGSISSLKRNVSKEDAVRQFTSPGFGTLYWRICNGPLQRIAEVYVPFFLYRVRYDIGGATRTRVFAIDAVYGSLDLFEFPRVPEERQLCTVETRNHLRSSLSPARAEELLRDKVMRVVFQQGFFKVRKPNVELARQSIDVHLPYWLALYGTEVVRCRVMDAVRRRIEGAKASAFFEDWLAA